MSAGQNCPTPYKKAYPNKGQAFLVVDRQKKRAKRGKGRWDPVAPYQCACGQIHLASADRVRVLK